MAMEQISCSVKLALLVLFLLEIVNSIESSTASNPKMYNHGKLEDKETTRFEPSHRNPHIEADPVVFDVNSLYESTRSGRRTGSIKRKKRSTANSNPSAQLVDACQSKMEILTPYYATNSKGKLRTVVNSELMQQAIQVETCIRSPTNQIPGKCSAQQDCGCEQKYKWHRLLVLDPRDSGVSQGLFMDWFLFPSSCVCRCKITQWTSKQFLRTIKRTEG